MFPKVYVFLGVGLNVFYISIFYNQITEKTKHKSIKKESDI